MNPINKPLQHKKIVGWFIFISLAIVLPAIILWLATTYVAGVMAETKLRRYQLEASDVLERLRISSDSGSYLCNRINDIFTHSGNSRELTRNIEILGLELDHSFDYLVWAADGKVATASFAWQSIKADWQQAFASLYDISINWREKIPLEENANLRRIFGPQFFPEMHSSCYSGKNLKPLFGDSSMKTLPAWVRAGKRFGLVVFLREKLLQGMAGIEFQVKKTATNYDFKLAAIVNNKLIADPTLRVEATELAAISQNFINPQKIGQFYVFKSILKTDAFGFCFLPAAKIEQLYWGTAWKLLFALFVAIGLLISWQSFQVTFGGQKLNLSVRRQLVILFLVANSLSLVILAILGFDYLQQYNLFLQTEAFRKGMTYLQSIDEMFITEFSRQQRIMEKSVEQIKADLSADKPRRKIVLNILALQKTKPFRMFLIGSNTPHIFSELGIMEDGKFVEEINMDWARYKSMQTLVDAMGKLGAYYLSLLNRETLSPKIQTQLELIAESLGQMRPIEMFQEFFAATGTFWQWGMGARKFPAYINVLRMSGQDIADYVFLYLWNSAHLQRSYIEQAISDLNRNPHGLTIMAVEEDFRFSFPADVLQHKQLRLFSSKLRERSGSELEYCNWRDEKHLLLGLKCSSISMFRLIALYPMADIDQKVRQKLYLFLGFALISFFVSIGLGLFVSRSILLPLAELQKGVVALKKRDFAYRLPELGQDEFGDLARIFNTTLVDLEELHVAAVVQEKLGEKMQGVQHHGNFTFYAGSHPVQKLGGDYFALSGIDERYLGIAIGDVVGSGVSASLLIAYIKACLLQLGQLQLQPQALLVRLWELIIAAGNNGQRKFATFQYCVLDAISNKATIANAGHCYPLVLNVTTGQIRVVELPSTPLGSGKSPRISALTLNLCAEDVLILYSGGLYRNGNIGFDKLCKIISCSYDSCPQKFHDKVIREIFTLTPADDCNDDMSLAIIATQNAGDPKPFEN